MGCVSSNNKEKQEDEITNVHGQSRCPQQDTAHQSPQQEQHGETSTVRADPSEKTNTTSVRTTESSTNKPPKPSLDPQLKEYIPSKNVTEDIEERLRFIKTLGSGATCSVVLATYRDPYVDSYNNNNNKNNNNNHAHDNNENTNVSPPDVIIEHEHQTKLSLRVNTMSSGSTTPQLHPQLSDLPQISEIDADIADETKHAIDIDMCVEFNNYNSNSNNNNKNNNINNDDDENYNYIDKPGLINDKSNTFSFLDNIVNERFALKVIKREYPRNNKVFCDEVKILTKLQKNSMVSDNYNCNFVQLITCYLDKNNYYIATEYCKGGALLDFIRCCKIFNEKQASYYIRELLTVVQFIHNLGIAHRDIKPANIMFDKLPILNENFDGNDRNGGLFINDAKLVLIDFGAALEIENDDEEYKGVVGTLVYLPPEICKVTNIKGRTGWETKMGDIWSIGIITYILLVGTLPFYSSKGQKQILDFIQFASLEWPHKTYTMRKLDISDRGKDFVSKLLIKQPKDRMKIEEALKHDWIADNENNPVSNIYNNANTQLLCDVANFDGAGT